MNLDNFLQEAGQAIDLEIQQDIVRQFKNDPEGILQILAFNFGFGEKGTRQGKKFRPILMLLICQAFNGEWRNALPAAAAIEMIHNYSLIHDDIEDGDQKRRGRKTVWAEFGMPLAVNAGDALLTAGFHEVTRLRQNHSCETTSQAGDILTEAVAGLTTGQSLDLQFQNREATRMTMDAYLQMARLKTARLVSASAEVGCLLGDHRADDLENMRELGIALGMAFQIRDDWLGIWGDEFSTGKSANNDLLINKKSFPIVFAIEQKRSYYDALVSGKLQTMQVGKARKLLEDDGADLACKSTAADWMDKAKVMMNDYSGERQAFQLVQGFCERLENRAA